MADYVLGDIQGCYDPLRRLLDKIDFCEQRDKLWFVGDLVNRGPQSLEVLRFIRALPEPRITLGNHDLHLLRALFVPELTRFNPDDTLQALLSADDSEELGHWLRQQPLLIVDEALDVAVCHAGIAPMWHLSDAIQHAKELEEVLQGEEFLSFLRQMYGNQPDGWRKNLTGVERLRVITNYFTRMRFCDREGNLIFNYKGTLEKAPADLFPWYAVPNRKPIQTDIVFGHWAALQGRCPLPHMYAIDTGCLWGGQLTALRLQDRQRFSVPGESYRLP